MATLVTSLEQALFPHGLSNAHILANRSILTASHSKRAVEWDEDKASDRPMIVDALVPSKEYDLAVALYDCADAFNR